MQPESARRWLVDAGHIGVFVGREALRRAWPELLAWVREAEARGDGPIAAAPVPTLPGPTTSGDVPAAPARGRPRARARAGSTD
jgi:hypothetical protein